MSFKVIEPARARLNRSELAVPGSQPQFFEKAAKGAADIIFLDLEDAVAPNQKVEARGLLYRESGQNLLNLTSLESIGGSCTN